jgi:hypothetical protein
MIKTLRVSKKISRKPSRKRSKKISRKSPRKISKRVSRKPLRKTSKRVSRKSPRKISRKPSRKPSRKISKKVSRKISKKVSRKISKKVSRKPSRKISKRVSRKPSRKTSKRVSRKISKKVSRKPSRKISKRVSRKPSRKISRKSPRKISKRVSRKPSRKISKRVSRKPSRKISKRVSRKPPRKISKRVSRKPSRKISKKVSRKPSRKISKVSKKVSSKTSKKVSENLNNEKDRWDILIHASSPESLKFVKDSGGFNTSFNQIDAWLDRVQDTFNNYFQKKDNRFNIIELLAKHGKNIADIKHLDPNDDNLYKIPKLNYKDYFVFLPGVYTYYLWDKMTYDGDCWSYKCNYPVLYGISTKILQDKPWVACPTTMRGECVEKKLEKGFYSVGNLSKKPDMTNIKKAIEDKTKRINIINHEIIFKEIPLKYIKVIFVIKKYLNEAKKLYPNIPVVEIAEFQEGRSNYKQILEPYADKI